MEQFKTHIEIQKGKRHRQYMKSLKLKYKRIYSQLYSHWSSRMKRHERSVRRSPKKDNLITQTEPEIDTLNFESQIERMCNIF